MKRKTWQYIRSLYILGIVLIIGGFLSHSNNELTGFHVFENIIGDGQYIFYIKPNKTATYTFRVNDFLKNGSYEVYNMENSKLVSSGTIGFRSEGYYPFIEMNLTKNKIYKIFFKLEDKNTYAFANVEYIEAEIN